MNALRLWAGVFAVVMVSGVRAEEKKEDKKDNAKLIVGSWEVVKADKNNPPEGSTIEFAKDGKAKMVTKVDDKDMTMEGTYTVVGDKLTVSRKGDMDKSITIKKLTATELTVFDAKENKTIEFKRKK